MNFIWSNVIIFYISDKKSKKLFSVLDSFKIALVY